MIQERGQSREDREAVGWVAPEFERRMEILLIAMTVVDPRLSPRQSGGRLTLFRSQPAAAGDAARAPASCTWYRTK